MIIGKCHRSARGPRDILLAWGWWIMGVCAGLILACGCGPPFNDVLINEQGETVRVEGVQRILNDNELTEEQKRDALVRYGITDEALLDALLSL